MKISINGESREYEGEATLGDLLRFLGVSPKSVAVERNLKILGRSEMESEPVEPGDSFEIIRLVGGG
ncbi:MAG: sulfur carrier protein ThiS [Syntrophobacter sp.]